MPLLINIIESLFNAFQPSSTKADLLSIFTAIQSLQGTMTSMSERLERVEDLLMSSKNIVSGFVSVFMSVLVYCHVSA